MATGDAKRKFAGHNDSGNPVDLAYKYTVTTTDSGGIRLGATFKDPTAVAPDGFLVVDVNGTEYEVPFYARA